MPLPPDVSSGSGVVSGNGRKCSLVWAYAVPLYVLWRWTAAGGFEEAWGSQHRIPIAASTGCMQPMFQTLVMRWKATVGGGRKVGGLPSGPDPEAAPPV